MLLSFVLFLLCHWSIHLLKFIKIYIHFIWNVHKINEWKPKEHHTLVGLKLKNLFRTDRKMKTILTPLISMTIDNMIVTNHIKRVMHMYIKTLNIIDKDLRRSNRKGATDITHCSFLYVLRMRESWLFPLHPKRGNSLLGFTGRHVWSLLSLLQYYTCNKGVRMTITYEGR